MKQLVCVVEMLDGMYQDFHLERNAKGKDLIEEVCKHLEIQETEYFGCAYFMMSEKFWLREEKPVQKQLEGDPVRLVFGVKYYPPEPSILHEDTRYYIFLQVRNDLSMGRLPCSYVTMALLASYAVQSHLGDYDEVEHGLTNEYLNTISFFTSSRGVMSDEMVQKVFELHKTHTGLHPAEAEYNFLMQAKNLAMYGVHLYDAVDSRDSDLQIGISSAGVSIYRDKLRIDRFIWARILKISYLKNNFIVLLRKNPKDSKGSKVSYKLLNTQKAKKVWRLAVDHHRFFRLREEWELGNHYSVPNTPSLPRHSSFHRTNSSIRTNHAATLDANWRHQSSKTWGLSRSLDRGGKRIQSIDRIIDTDPNTRVGRGHKESCKRFSSDASNSDDDARRQRVVVNRVDGSMNSVDGSVKERSSYNEKLDRVLQQQHTMQQQINHQYHTLLRQKQLEQQKNMAAEAQRRHEMVSQENMKQHGYLEDLDDIKQQLQHIHNDIHKGQQREEVHHYYNLNNYEQSEKQQSLPEWQPFNQKNQPVNRPYQPFNQPQIQQPLYQPPQQFDTPHNTYQHNTLNTTTYTTYHHDTPSTHFPSVENYKANLHLPNDVPRMYRIEDRPQHYNNDHDLPDEPPAVFHDEEIFKQHIDDSGLIITERRVQRPDGVVERFIERRRPLQSDHDNMLSAAIRQTTMLPDHMDVRRIEVRADVEEYV